MSSRSSARPDLARLLRFGATGLANTAVGYGVILAGLAMGVGDIAANAAGYAVGLCLSFALHKRWTFATAHGFRPNLAVRYVLAFVIAYGANFAVVLLATRLLGLEHNPFVQLAAIAAYTVTFYLLSAHFVFVAPTDSISAR